MTYVNNYILMKIKFNLFILSSSKGSVVFVFCVNRTGYFGQIKAYRSYFIYQKRAYDTMVDYSLSLVKEQFF